MTSRGRTLEVRFIGDADDAIRALRAMNRELGNTAAEEQRADAAGRTWGSTLGSLRGNYLAMTAAATAAVAATAGVTAAVVSAVKAATDQVEAQSRVEAVYKSSADTILNWADDSATAFGLARAQALGAAGDFGNMFSQLGIGLDVSAQMSTQMVELAADFASFHNADITDVLIAQSAAFRGEYDAVQRFVPIINAAAVQERALKMGLAATSDELTAQDKALATHALLLEGAGDAAGDFDRTSGNLANQQRILGAQLADIRAEIGEALLPVVSDIVGNVSDWIARNEELLQQDIPNAIQEMADAAGNFLTFLNDIANFGPIRIGVEFVMSSPNGQGLLSRLTGQAAFENLEELGGIWQDRIAGWFGSDSANQRMNEIRDRRAFNEVFDAQGRFGGLTDEEVGTAGGGPAPWLLRNFDRNFEREFGALARSPGRAGGGGGGRASAIDGETEAERRARVAQEITDARNLQLVQKQMAEAVFAAEQAMRESEEAIRAETEARRELTASLASQIAGTSFFQRVGERDPGGAAAQAVALAEEIRRLNASIGLDEHGNPLPGGAVNDYRTQNITVVGDSSGQVRVLDGLVQ